MNPAYSGSDDNDNSPVSRYRRLREKKSAFEFQVLTASGKTSLTQPLERARCYIAVRGTRIVAFQPLDYELLRGGVYRTWSHAAHLVQLKMSRRETSRLPVAIA